MKLEELFEGISPVVYHATSVFNLLNILRTNQFELRPSFTKTAEAGLGTSMYFMSVTRTRTGTYHMDNNHYNALIRLDGRKLGQRYAGSPVDYYGPNFRNVSNGGYEQEDRIFSDKPEIPNAKSYIESIDIIVPEHRARMRSERENRRAIAVYRELKKAGIPVRFFDDKASWISGNASRAMSHDDILDMSDPDADVDNFGGGRSIRYIDPDVTMVYKALKFDNLNQMNDEEHKSLRSLINYYHMEKGRPQKASFHNASSAPQMRNILHLISIEMRKLGLRNIDEALYHIMAKWQRKT